MFRQSLIQVFRGLAEFHGYVPVILTLEKGSDETAATSQAKQIAAVPKPSTSLSCC